MSIEMFRRAMSPYVDFYEKVAKILPDKPRIYYPGSGAHNSFGIYFEKARLDYLDLNYPYPPNKDLIVADYSKAPFREEVYDMLYFNDNHATHSDFREMLRTVKTRGLIVFNHDTCMGKFKVSNARKHEKLQELEEPRLAINSVEICTVFRKLQ